MINFENLDRAQFRGIGKYDIPEILPEHDIGAVNKWLPFNYILSAGNTGKNAGVHCFVDDYQFVRLWNSPNTYLRALLRFECVCAPDFSTYTDMPRAMQIYNHYRKHWIAAYWQKMGICVIPVISWSDESSFEWCFDGEPHGGIVAISNVGCLKEPKTREMFYKGFEEMKKRLEPEMILCCGTEMDGCVNIPPHWKKIVEKRKAGK